ncbi:MAG TPA: hypothetical protein VEW42_00040 [Candidatus Eisenbacteria bacterium]|nr:hypothetical protein [Candidatus Eisenbacteria bacterium]
MSARSVVIQEGGGYGPYRGEFNPAAITNNKNERLFQQRLAILGEDEKLGRSPTKGLLNTLLDQANQPNMPPVQSAYIRRRVEKHLPAVV